MAFLADLNKFASAECEFARRDKRKAVALPHGIVASASILRCSVLSQALLRFVSLLEGAQPGGSPD
jgi:hypothetical protein